MSKNAATATGDDTADLLLLAPASTESPLGTTTADPYLNTTIDYILSTVATATGISGWRWICRSTAARWSLS